jgi:uncharacterized protein YecE (DUF72 family)
LNSHSKTKTTGRIYCGVAGWSYPDWEGVVYPRPRKKSFDPLLFLSGIVDVIEVNSTFYHPGPRKNALSWAGRLSETSGFKLTVKLWRRFSHQREPFGKAEVSQARTVPEVLAEAGLLGALLVQFPWSFKNSEENRKWLIRVAKSFNDFPLAVELRHESWDRPEFYQMLKEAGTAFVNIDQPVIGASIKPSSTVTADFGYVRLHGRNYESWFREDAGRDDRYDYLYTVDELRPWAERIEEAADQRREVYAVFNNHYKGQALANALQLKSMLGRPARAPEPLARAYPELDVLEG